LHGIGVPVDQYLFLAGDGYLLVFGHRTGTAIGKGEYFGIPLVVEQVRLIQELDDKDKNIIMGMIETMLTKKKFKDFFNKNVATL